MAEIANDKILAEIREIKSDLQSLKKQGNNANANREVSTCKEQKIGGTYQHCFACGEFGHIASECAKNLKGQGNEYRQPHHWDRV